MSSFVAKVWYIYGSIIAKVLKCSIAGTVLGQFEDYGFIYQRHGGQREGGRFAFCLPSSPLYPLILATKYLLVTIQKRAKGKPLTVSEFPICLLIPEKLLARLTPLIISPSTAQTEHFSKLS